MIQMRRYINNLNPANISPNICGFENSIVLLAFLSGLLLVGITLSLSQWNPYLHPSGHLTEEPVKSFDIRLLLFDYHLCGKSFGGNNAAVPYFTAEIGSKRGGCDSFGSDGSCRFCASILIALRKVCYHVAIAYLSHRDSIAMAMP